MPPIGKWDFPVPRKAIVIGVADMVVCNDPAAELVTYSLGSCLAIAVYDSVKKVGGLLHVMLPDSTIDPDRAQLAPYMFVDTGVPRLFHAVYSLGGDRNRVVIKVVGGAQLLDPQGIFNIGERNYRSLTGLLARHDHKIHAQDIGGFASRTVRMDLATGIISIKSPATGAYFL
ncbi:MAG: cheD [Verrucomicrobiales bacterium]|nr:cheD [Verrucomicrobiales bacterium]